MSNLANRPEQSTDDEIATLENLALLSPSGPGQFIRKTSLTTFENATPAGGGGTPSIARTFMLMGA